jgi:hypothetical protein
MYALIATALIHAAACGSGTVTAPVGQEKASASLWANVTRSRESLREKGRELLKQARRQTDPPGGCPSGCARGEGPVTVLRSVPARTDLDYQGADACAEKQAETTARPFEVQDKHFDTPDSVYDWIVEFSQGHGPEGRALYEECSDNCSPRYSFYIRPAGSDLAVDTKVICGPKRDRSDNSYDLSAENIWSCGNEKG